MRISVKEIGNQMGLSGSKIFTIAIICLLLLAATIMTAKAQSYTFVLKWGSYGSETGQFNYPYGVAIDSSDYVYIADGSNHRVQKFDSDGGFLATWGGLDYPLGVAVDSAGNVYVTDFHGHSVQKRDSSGNLLTIWGSYGSDTGQFKYPYCVAVDSVGNVYVTDIYNYRIQKFTSEGVFLSTWGSQGWDDGEFQQPVGIAVDSSGNVYVTDFGDNHRVQKFDSNGGFLDKWEGYGSGDGQFNYPWGVVVDSAGFVYVTEVGNNRVQKFTNEGVFVTKWDNQGSGDGEFQQPVGIAVDSAGNVYIVDNNNHRVQKFQPPNSPPLADAGSPYIGLEGSLVVFDAAASTDPDSDSLQYRWDFESNGVWTLWSSSATATHTWDDDWSGVATLEVNDGQYASSDTVSVTINNMAPVISSITASFALVPIGASIEFYGVFTDLGIADTQTAVWSWGNQQTSSGTVSSYAVAGLHTYSAAGIYSVTLTVTDDNAGSDTEALNEYVVVYDPTAGFVTGGGWINSPQGAYTADPALSGKATFGFVSKYQKGTNVPSGQTEFMFHVGGLNFKSTSYDWLVVAGTKAQYKGTGMINGEGNFGFMLTAVDGGAKGSDLFRIKIWDKASGLVVYDNNLGDADGADPSTVIAGGSIKIHK